ncbi:refilin-B-like [Ptychodera flava]|uniref:refilin-B-like n=1 Tax=Ptychodera flava TaxID=63121 RepID=UPI00396A9892
MVVIPLQRRIFVVRGSSSFCDLPSNIIIMVVCVKPGEHCNYTVEHSNGIITPYYYSETVALARSPSCEEHLYGQRCHYEQHQRYKEDVQCVPKLVPKWYSTTVSCDDGYHYHKTEIRMEPSMKGRRFSSTVFVFPKCPVITHTSTLNYRMEGTRRWYTSSLELEAKDYATMKILFKGENDF